MANNASAIEGAAEAAAETQAPPQRKPERICNPNARLATLDQLKVGIIQAYLSPVPTDHTLRAMFDEANIPRFKSNPAAKRGGGPCFYSVSHVEKWLRSRLLPGRIAAPAVTVQTC